MMHQSRNQNLRKTAKMKTATLMTALTAMLTVCTVMAVVSGAAAIPVGSALRILFSPGSAGGGDFYNASDFAMWQGIIWQLRLPRIIQAALVGASLAVAGTVFQGLFRNPMADPYVLGISSGAALGAVTAMLMGGMFTVAGFSAVPLFAFAGGAATIVGVYTLARIGKTVPVMTLLLTGIAAGAFLSAFVSLLTYFAGEKLDQVVFWMMGGMGSAGWGRIAAMLPYVLAGYAGITVYAKELDVLLLGEETAHHLGVNTEKIKKILLMAASLLVAAAVSTSGIIGFVGLIVPHFIRIVMGPGHKTLLPASALLGASLLIAADTLARTVIAPAELPVGIITAMVGAPIFVILLKKRRKLRYFNSAD